MMNRYRVILIVPHKEGDEVLWTESPVGEFKNKVPAVRRARQLAWNHRVRVPPYWSAGCRIVDRKTGRTLGDVAV